MGFLAPVFTLIGSVLGSAIGKMVVGIGLNLLVSKMEARRAKKAQQQAAGGTQFERDYGEDISRKAACGPVGIAGHDCYVNTYGSANKNLEQNYLFSDFPCDGLTKIYAGGTELSIALGGDGRYAVTAGDYAGRMFFTFYDGTQTQADAGLIAHSNPAGRWTADHLGSGLCWLKVELIYDQEKLNQFPDFFFEIRGARLYDFRKDSSVGGNGNHRWGNYSTYEYSENPVIMDYNYRRGFSWNGDLFLGMDMPASDLPFEQYVTAANICDEFVSYGRRYRCSILLDADLDHGDNIDALMLSCGGIVIDSVEGSWPLIGSEQPIAFTFTDDDLVKSEPLQFRKHRSMGELVNSVSGTYQEPANMWSPAGYDQQTDAAYVAKDRRTRDEPLNFPMVFSKGQANQLASIYFNENRFEATASVVLRPRFRTVKAGDWGYWDSKNEKRRGVYMVQSRSIRALDSDGPRNVALSLQERSGQIYKSVGVIPPTIPLPNAQPIYLAQLQDFAVIPVIGVGTDGRSYPGFRISWARIDDVTVRAIDFEYWIKDEPQNVFTRTVTPDTIMTVLQEGILSLTDYQFRYKLAADRPTSFTIPITVRSLDGGNGGLEIGLGEVRADISGRLLDLQAGIDAVTQRVIEISDSIALEGAVGHVERRVLRSDVGKAFAEVSEEVRVRTLEGEAAAGRITAVNTRVDDANTRIANEENARSTAVESIGQRIGLVETSVGAADARIANEELARSTAVEAVGQRIGIVETSVGAADTRIANEETARTTADAAIGERVGIVETSVGDANSRITSVETAMVDGDHALAQSIDSVRAEMGDVLADGYLSITAQTSGSTLSQIELAARAQKGGAAALAALIMRVYLEGGVLKTENIHVANRTIFVDENGQNGQAIVVFDENGATLAVANIGTVNAGLIQSPNGKMAINVNAGTMVIRS